MKKRLLSILLCLTLVLSLVIALGLTASAETAAEVAYVDESGTAQTPVAATVVSDSDFTWGDDGNDGWYVVNSKITVIGTYTVSGDVKLILADGCKLDVTAEGASSKAGINVAEGTRLTIYGQTAGTGTLKATGKGNTDNRFGGAGIGGNGSGDSSTSGQSCGTITINGGTITSTGATHAAGIGGGFKGIGSNITINGGKVTAKGGGNGAGIGGGSGKIGKNIAINGGTVTATGGSNAVGIGSGKDGSAATGISVDTGLFIKSGASSASSTAFHFAGADDANFKVRYLIICPELCEFSGQKYGFFDDVLKMVWNFEGANTIKLLRDLTISKDCTLPPNTTIALNNYNFTVASGKRLSGENIAFDIASDKDMETVNRINYKETTQYEETSGESTVKVSHIRIPEIQVWNIRADITTKSAIRASRLKKLTVNGNGYTISGADDVSEDPKETYYVMSFTSATPSGSEKEPNNIISWGTTITVNNLKIQTNEKFEKCVYVQSNSKIKTKRANVTFNNVTFDNATSKSAYDGACIVNNWGDVTLKGTCAFITGENSYSAIDLTKTVGDATLTFDSAAVLTFTDGRVMAETIKEPLIGFDVDVENTDYDANAKWIVNGFDAEKIGIVDSLRGTKDGYDFPVCEMSGVKYGSISKALSVAGDTKTIKLLCNSAEIVTIDAGQNVTLDLNGFVLNGGGTDSVITNNGTLTIKDSNATAGHYFNYVKNGTWTYYGDSEPTEGTPDIDTVDAIDADTDYVKVLGGCITGGKEIWGGGADNKGTLTIEGGNIVGCTATEISVGEGEGEGGEGGEGGEPTGKSTYRGGAVYNSGKLTVKGGSILGCTANEEGGAIFNTADADLQGGSIEYCCAQNGGAIYNMKDTADNSLKVAAKIKNCSATGTEDGIGYGGAIYNGLNASLTLTGSIEKCSTEKFGGGVFNKGDFTMNTGAVIKECSADKGAGVHNDGTAGVTFTMNAGEIKNNNAAKNGGGVQNSENAVFNFNGGSITGNNSKDSFGGGVFTKGTMTIKNSAAISDNTTGSSTKTSSNLTVVKGYPVTLDNYTGDKIGVSVIAKNASKEGKPYEFTSGNATASSSADLSDKLKSDNASYEVRKYKNGENYFVKFASAAAVCQITSNGDFKGNEYDTVAEALTDAGTTATTIKLLRDTTENVTIAEGKNITLDLNDKVLSAPDAGGSVITNNGTLNIVDTAENKTVRYYNINSGTQKYWVPAASETDYKVTGGVITNGTGTILTNNNSKSGGGVFNNGVLTMTDVNIVGNHAGYFGSGIYNTANGDATLTDVDVCGNTAHSGGGIYNCEGGQVKINGGIIYKNQISRHGAGICNEGALTLNGTSVTGNYASKDGSGAGINWRGGTLTLSGKVTVKGNKVGDATVNLYINFDDCTHLFTIGAAGLSEDSEIGVTHYLTPNGADAIRTIGAANAVDYSGAFEADNGAYSVVYNTDTKQLELKQTTFYVSDQTGNDSTGNGTSAKPYATIQKAAQMANGTGAVKMLSGVTLTENITLPKNTNIIINGKDIRTSTYTITAENLTILVSDSTDFEKAAAMVNRYDGVLKCTWKLTDDITVSKGISLRGKIGDVTIDGNGKTITATGDTDAESQGHVFYVKSSDTDHKTVEIKNLTIVLLNGFRGGVCFDKDNDAGSPSVTATLTDLTIKAERTIAPKNSDLNDKTGTLIQNNACAIVVKRNINLTTDEFCWSAVDIDSGIGAASLTFDVNGDDKAIASFVDNRTDDTKQKEPFIGISDSNSTVSNYAEVGLSEVLKENNSNRTKDGYDLKADPCIYSAPLTAGDEAQLLILGGKEAGEFTISGDSKNGFTLKNADGKFVSYAGGTLKTDSSTAYTWKYDGGLYAETKTTTRSGFWFWSRPTTTVTKTYLTFDGEAFGTSCSKVCAEVQVTDNEHTWAYLHDGDGKHEAYCTKCGHHEDPEDHKYDETTHLCVCGKLDPKQCYVSDVEVTEKKTTSYGGWWLFTRKITKYQYTIKPVAQNVGVAKVQYSSNKENWNNGTVFTSDVKLSKFYIRVTDTNGNETVWEWNGGEYATLVIPD